MSDDPVQQRADKVERLAQEIWPGCYLAVEQVHGKVVGALVVRERGGRPHGLVEVEDCLIVVRHEHALDVIDAACARLSRLAARSAGDASGQGGER